MLLPAHDVGLGDVVRVLAGFPDSDSEQVTPEFEAHHAVQRERHHLGRGVPTGKAVELALRDRLQRTDQRLVAVVQQERVVPVRVDPVLQRSLDVTEVDGEAEIVEFGAPDEYLGAVRVAMGRGAFPVVVEEAVRGIERDLDPVHEHSGPLTRFGCREPSRAGDRLVSSAARHLSYAQARSPQPARRRATGWRSRCC